MRLIRVIVGIALSSVGCVAAWAAYRLYQGSVIAPTIPGPSTTVHARVYIGRFEISDFALVVALGVGAFLFLGAGTWTLSASLGDGEDDA